MPLIDWNRYRHDTYKEDRAAERPYIWEPGDGGGGGGAAAAAAAAEVGAESARPEIYGEFEYLNDGTHELKPKNGGAPKIVPCEYWRCKNHANNGKCTRRPIKVVNESTGKLFGHLRSTATRSGGQSSKVSRAPPTARSARGTPRERRHASVLCPC